MADSALQKIVESLNQDLEEKIYQLSQVRQVAEAVSRSIHETHYFNQLCNDFVKLFNASLVCLFWQRHREPRGWWLDAWASGGSPLHPARKTVPEEEEGIFAWIKRLRKPHLLEDAAGEPFLTIWGDAAPRMQQAALIPLHLDEPRLGMLVMIDPVIRLSPRSLQLQLDILSSLINAGVHNRLLYRTIQESEEEFRDLYENSSDMVVVAYPDGIIRDCNSLFRHSLNLPQNPQGLRLNDLIGGDRGVFEDCWEILLKGQSVSNVPLHLIKDGGGGVEAELSGNVRYSEDGRPGLIRLYLRDVTERHASARKQNELELELELVRERQLAQVGLYLSGIAHNLQNPVQVLLGYIELLKMKLANVPELNIIEQSTQSIMNIIRNLLDKMQKERNPETTPVNISELLDSELTFLNANSFFKHEVQKSFELDKNIPPIDGIYSDFSQALMNIVYNALDAMRDREDKELKIRTSYDEQKRLITATITDTGPGIPYGIREDIFKPFFTTKKKNSRDEDTGLSSGSGLGLSSSVALLKGYGGKITFESDPGKGTTFIITIPAKSRSGDSQS